MIANPSSHLKPISQFGEDKGDSLICLRGRLEERFEFNVTNHCLIIPQRPVAGAEIEFARHCLAFVTFVYSMKALLFLFAVLSISPQVHQNVEKRQIAIRSASVFKL